MQQYLSPFCSKKEGKRSLGEGNKTNKQNKRNQTISKSQRAIFSGTQSFLLTCLDTEERFSAKEKFHWRLFKVIQLFHTVFQKSLLLKSYEAVSGVGLGVKYLLEEIKLCPKDE